MFSVIDLNYNTISNQWKSKIKVRTYNKHLNYLNLQGAAEPLHPSQRPFNTSTISLGSGPLSKFSKLDCNCSILEAPMIIASPCSLLSIEWCDNQRKAISAIVKLFVLAISSIMSSAPKKVSLQKI